jgi:hypothetical protein
MSKKRTGEEAALDGSRESDSDSVDARSAHKIAATDVARTASTTAALLNSMSELTMAQYRAKGASQSIESQVARMERVGRRMAAKMTADATAVIRALVSARTDFVRGVAAQQRALSKQETDVIGVADASAKSLDAAAGMASAQLVPLRVRESVRSTAPLTDLARSFQLPRELGMASSSLSASALDLRPTLPEVPIDAGLTHPYGDGTRLFTFGKPATVYIAPRIRRELYESVPAAYLLTDEDFHVEIRCYPPEADAGCPRVFVGRADDGSDVWTLTYTVADERICSIYMSVFLAGTRLNDIEALSTFSPYQTPVLGKFTLSATPLWMSANSAMVVLAYPAVYMMHELKHDPYFNVTFQPNWRNISNSIHEACIGCITDENELMYVRNQDGATTLICKMPHSLSAEKRVHVDVPARGTFPGAVNSIATHKNLIALGHATNVISVHTYTTRDDGSTTWQFAWPCANVVAIAFVDENKLAISHDTAIKLYTLNGTCLKTLMQGVVCTSLAACADGCILAAWSQSAAASDAHLAGSSGCCAFAADGRVILQLLQNLSYAKECTPQAVAVCGTRAYIHISRQIPDALAPTHELITLEAALNTEVFEDVSDNESRTSDDSSFSDVD